MNLTKIQDNKNICVNDIVRTQNRMFYVTNDELTELTEKFADSICVVKSISTDTNEWGERTYTVYNSELGYTTMTDHEIREAYSTKNTEYISVTVPKARTDFYKKFIGITGDESVKLGEHYDNQFNEECYFKDGTKAIITLVIADYDNLNWVGVTLFDTFGNEIADMIQDFMFNQWYIKASNGTTYILDLKGEE